MATTDTPTHAPVGRFTSEDVDAIVGAAHELGQYDKRLGRHAPDPHDLLAACLCNPAGIGWRLTLNDLRPDELCDLRALVASAYLDGRSSVGDALLGGRR